MLIWACNSVVRICASGLFPAWPCGDWSVRFKLHAPKRTVIEGDYNHTTGALKLRIEPESRRADLKIMGCATTVEALCPQQLLRN